MAEYHEEFEGYMDFEICPVEQPTPMKEGNREGNEDSPLKPEIQLTESRYENRAGTFTTGIDIFSEEEKLKMEERAKRFGLTDRLKNNFSNQEQQLYASMGITENNESTKNARLNVIHMRGTEDMSTKDVFKYFEDYAPASIEWINDVSCNVVWLDNVSATRAMLGLSKTIVGLGERPGEQDPLMNSSNSDAEKALVNPDPSLGVDSHHEMNAESSDKSQDDSISVKDISCPLPPGLWRKGTDYPKSSALFLRFASRSDKKQPNAEKMSEYYKKHGNPNFGGIKGLLTESRKRMYKQIKQNKRPLEEPPEDEATDRKRSKNPWGALSESWGVNDAVEDVFVQNLPNLPNLQNVPSVQNTQQDQGRSVKERLGTRVPQKEQEPEIGERKGPLSGSDSEDDWCKRSKILRMRMHADDEEEKIHKRRVKAQRDTLLSKLERADDLRSRLGRSKKDSQFREAIQVVVTNPKASRPTTKAESSEEEDGEIVEDESQEKEEGEWHASEEEPMEQEAEEEEVEEEGEGQAAEESDEESDEPVKEAQGPKGSVIKVVQHKPQVASTVWARLNNVQSDVIDSTVKDRQPKPRDLRETLRGGDLRSRIGNHTRGRSPLRIEVKNDKYMEDPSDTE